VCDGNGLRIGRVGPGVGGGDRIQFAVYGSTKYKNSRVPAERLARVLGKQEQHFPDRTTLTLRLIKPSL
jgi:hypothetical protein